MYNKTKKLKIWMDFLDSTVMNAILKNYKINKQQKWNVFQKINTIQ